MRIGTPKQQLKELEQDKRIQGASLGDRCFGKDAITGERVMKDSENERTHLTFTLSKKHLALELMVIDSKLVCSISTTTSFTQDLVNNLVDKLLMNGFDTWGNHKDSDRNPRFDVNEEDPLTTLFAMKHAIESDEELENSITSARTFEASEEEYYPKAFNMLKTAVKDGMTRCLGRELFDNDKIRSWITENTYNKFSGLIWFEHLVPIDYIFTTLINMINDGVSDEECIAWLKRNLIGRYITNTQAKWLDYIAGYKTTMPEGQEDNPNARFDLVIKEGIE